MRLAVNSISSNEPDFILLKILLIVVLLLLERLPVFLAGAFVGIAPDILSARQTDAIVTVASAP